MVRIGLIVFLFLALSSPCLAQEPTPAPGGGGITVEQESLPYTFAPYDFDEGGSPAANLDLFQNVTFINQIGSTILTVFTILDTQNVLAIFVILLLAVWLLTKIYLFTVRSTPEKDVDLSFDNPYNKGGS